MNDFIADLINQRMCGSCSFFLLIGHIDAGVLATSEM